MRIELDKTRIQAIVIAIPLVIAIAAGMYYIFLVRPTYGVFHEPLMAQDTAVRVILKPVLIQSYVSSLAPTGSKFIKGIPKVSSLQQFAFRTEWIHKMPFEFSFLLDQRSPEHFGVLLFIREHPTSESFADLVNGSNFFTDLYPIVWEQQHVSRKGTGQLIATGTLPIPLPTRKFVSKNWPDYAPLDAPAVTGRHFIEIAVNNSNGALMELHGALTRAVTPWANATLERNIYELWPSIQDVELTADLVEEDQILFEGGFTCTSNTQAENLLLVAETAAVAIGQYLQSSQGFSLSGRARLSKNSVRFKYTLSGFETRLRNALGG